MGKTNEVLVQVALGACAAELVFDERPSPMTSMPLAGRAPGVTVYGLFGVGSDGGSLTGSVEGSSDGVVTSHAPLQAALLWQRARGGHPLSVETVWPRPAGRLVPLASSCHAGPISLPRGLPISRQGWW